jgi:hypothetical protein
MVNTGELVRQYQHVNMTLEFQDSTDNIVDEQGTAQVLNLQNAQVLFTWDYEAGTSPYKIVLTGGGYRLHPFKSLTGGSYQPQIWCEVTQR